jgi:2-oxoglutarate ferredoxin oxidoreductase subunit gamma
MTHEIIISGFGGQGIMAIGKTLTEAGMKEGLSVSWLPSYGPEMRGGTANCSVVISGQDIISPMVLNPSELIAMNAPSLVKFESQVAENGKIFINSSIADEKVSRKDVSCFYVPCLEIAGELGNMKVANMVMLGAYIEATRNAFAPLHRPEGRACRGQRRSAAARGKLRRVTTREKTC